MGLILGGMSASDLIMDGQSVSLYVGGNPPVKVWPTRETVQITLDTGWGARNQLLAALTARGLKYWTITEIPFEIELVGTGSAQSMFDGCSSLTSVPNLDTSNVTDMRSMFNDCTSLTSVPPMDTSNVTSMEGMFSGCAALVSVPDMDTSNVTSMAYMFANCAALTTAPEMDTAKVTTMSSMFDGCSALTYVPEMDTRNVTDTNYMLYGCSALTDGNVCLIGRNPSVNTDFMIDDSGLTREPWYNADGNPIDVYEVSFSGEYGSGKLIPLVNVTIPAGEEWAVRVQGSFTRTTNWSASKPEIRIGTAISIKYSQGEAVDFSGTVNSSDSTIAAVMNRSNRYDPTDFVGTVTIEQVAKITLGTGYEARDQLRAALSARGLDYQTVTRIPFGIELVGSGSAREMFRDCAALTSVPTMDTSGVTSMRSMFYDCSSLVRVPDMDTSQVTHMGWVFYNCASLTSVPTMDTSSATNMYSMFSGCTLLKSVPAMDTSKVTDMSYMFSGCSALTSVPTMNTSQVTSTTWMFNDCASLKSVPTMNTSNVTTMRTMFQRCAALTYVPDLQASNVDDVSYMFYGCSALTDGNVRLIGKHPSVSTTNAIVLSGLTRIPFYDTSGNPI